MGLATRACVMYRPCEGASNEFQPDASVCVQFWRRIGPRGWSPLLAEVARMYPPMQSYRARLSDGDQLFIDLRGVFG